MAEALTPAEDAIDSMVTSFANRCAFRGRSVFVAWNGVLTLAYSGWPEGLVHFKASLEMAIPGIQRENPGSKWPKTSLGCIREESRALCAAEYEKLRRLCEEFENAAKQLRVKAHRLSVVVFASRCCERRMSVKNIDIPGDELDVYSEVSEDSLRLVEDVLKETEAAEYLEYVNSAGHRAAHYDSGSGVTLVQDCGETLQSFVEEFKAKVDELLPGVYRWFDTNALHVTVRGLVN